jgi:hypothetical protein
MPIFPANREVHSTRLRHMGGLTFEEFADFIREYGQLPDRTTISAETQFERDLGLTGDDGIDLLEATEKHFGVTFGSDETGVRETFNLSPNEHLFNSEGGICSGLVYCSGRMNRPFVSSRLENSSRPCGKPNPHQMPMIELTPPHPEPPAPVCAVDAEPTRPRPAAQSRRSRLRKTDFV